MHKNESVNFIEVPAENNCNVLINTDNISFVCEAVLSDKTIGTRFITVKGDGLTTRMKYQDIKFLLEPMTTEKKIDYLRMQQAGEFIGIIPNEYLGE